jgi:hypothetical protein
MAFQAPNTRRASSSLLSLYDTSVPDVVVHVAAAAGDTSSSSSATAARAALEFLI